jgi:ATP-dependent phosphoenolpyruvate carboxykinase
MIDNYLTFPDRRPPALKGEKKIDKILTEYSSNLPFFHKANICGATISLKTNSKHVYRFWQLNWYQSFSKDIDGEVYILTGIKGYEPCLFYDLDRKIAVGINSEYYGLAKSKAALGLAAEILKNKGKYPMHAASVGFGPSDDCWGVAMIAPTGTGKTTQFHELLYNVKSSKVCGDDYLFVYFDKNKKEVIAEQPEKQLYLRTEIAYQHPTFIKSFSNLPLENVVTKKEECRQKEYIGTCYTEVIERKRRCIFDEGYDRCYWSYGNSRIMFPRERFTMLIRKENGNVEEVFKGYENVVNKVKLKYVLLLTRDEENPPIRKIEEKECIKILKEGKFVIGPGSGPREKWGQYGYEPFYDPYQLEIDIDRSEKFFRKLFDYGVNFYLVNTGSYKGRKIQIHQTHAYIRAALDLN